MKQTASAKTTVYVDALYEQDSDGTVRKHIFLGANRICTVTSGSAQPKAFSYYHSDHLGSSNVITDESGNQIELVEYTPFGSFSKNGPANGLISKPVNYFYTGKELDAATNLYYYGARYYSHTIGKFTQPDPLIQNIYDPQTLNHYSYCRNNPLILIDPTGTTAQDVSDSWSADFSGAWDNFWESAYSSANSYWNSLSFGVTNAFQSVGQFWGSNSCFGEDFTSNNYQNHVNPWGVSKTEPDEQKLPTGTLNAPFPSDSYFIDMMNQYGFNLREQKPGVWFQSWGENTILETDFGGLTFFISKDTTMTVRYTGEYIYGIYTSKPVTIGKQNVPQEYGVNGTFSSMKLYFDHSNNVRALETDMSDSVICNLLKNGWNP